MQDAVIASNRKDEHELLKRTVMANQEMQAEAKRLADEIESLKAAVMLRPRVR